MCKIQYRNLVHVKTLALSFNLRGRRPLNDFVQELEMKILQRVYSLFRLWEHFSFDEYTRDMTQGG